MKSGNYKVSVYKNGKANNMGTFIKEKEALDVYNKKLQEFENSKEENKLPEIKKNREGQVIIEIFNKTNKMVAECIVDEDKYRELIGHSWYMTNGYVATNINNTSVRIHRYLMSPTKKEIVDHINNNPLDNRIINLRICNESLNSHNKKIKDGSYGGYGRNFNCIQRIKNHHEF